jgi:hypothetical protein
LQDYGGSVDAAHTTRRSFGASYRPMRTRPMERAKARVHARCNTTRGEWTTMSPDDPDAEIRTRLEFAAACLTAAGKLTELAAALMEQVEDRAQQDLADEVDRWLGALAQSARRHDPRTDNLGQKTL